MRLPLLIIIAILLLPATTLAQQGGAAATAAPAASADASAGGAAAEAVDAGAAEESPADAGAASEDAGAANPGAPASAGGNAAAVDPAAQKLFLTKCSSCHAFGKGKIVGPDLKGATDRRDEAWLRKFIKAPSTMLDSDPVAKQLLADHGGVRMPDLGLSDAEVDSLIGLIRTCSAQTCVLSGGFKKVIEATPDDVKLGIALFQGTTKLESGGPACIGCHAMQGAGGVIGGGSMSTDLTNAFARHGDEGLDKEIVEPGSPFKAKIYADHPVTSAEAFALRAALYDANRGALADGAEQISIPLVALIGTLLIIIALGAAWPRRGVGVREALVAAKEQQP